MLMTASLFGADNVLTPQEKAGGWVLLFDGKSLSGWDSVVPQGAGWGPGPGAGATPGGAPKQAKGSAQPGVASAVGSNPRPCSTPMAQSPVATGASHWEVAPTGGRELAPLWNSDRRRWAPRRGRLSPFPLGGLPAGREGPPGKVGGSVDNKVFNAIFRPRCRRPPLSVPPGGKPAGRVRSSRC
jgi:hypothetical protein